MKKKNGIAALIVFVLMFGGLAYTGEEKHARNMDGSDWTRFFQSQKTGFVLGFSAIQDILMRRARETNDFIDYVLPNLCPEKFESQREKLIGLRFKFHFPVEEFELNETAPGQILDDLEAFYADHQNLDIKIVNAI